MGGTKAPVQTKLELRCPETFASHWSKKINTKLLKALYVKDHNFQMGGCGDFSKEGGKVMKEKLETAEAELIAFRGLFDTELPSLDIHSLRFNNNELVGSLSTFEFYSSKCGQHWLWCCQEPNAQLNSTQMRKTVKKREAVKEKSLIQTKERNDGRRTGGNTLIERVGETEATHWGATLLQYLSMPFLK